MRFAWVIVVGLVVGCAASGPDDPCTEATDHIASCTDEQSTASATCDPDRAAAVLKMSCQDLAAAEAAGKADGWWDDFLCTLGFQSHCSGAGSGSGSNTPAPTSKTLSGQVVKLGTIDQPATNVYVRAIADGASTPTKGTWVVSGLFVITNLPVAKYKLEVALTTSSSAIATASIDLATQTYVVIQAPVP